MPVLQIIVMTEWSHAEIKKCYSFVLGLLYAHVTACMTSFGRHDLYTPINCRVKSNNYHGWIFHVKSLAFSCQTDSNKPTSNTPQG